MNLDEILKLDKVTSSVRQIDLYMSKQKINSYEYIRALAFKCSILHCLNKTKDALKLLLPITSLFDKIDKRASVSICDSLIEIFLDIASYKEAIKYINIKKNYIPELNKEDYYYDLIRYYNLIGNSLELKRSIVSYLQGDIPDDRRAYALEIFIDYQYKDLEYDGFYRSYDYLELYYKKNFIYDKLERLNLMKANMLMNEDKADLAYPFLEDLIKEEHITFDSKIKAITLIMEILMLKHEYRHASIIEAEYTEVYMNASTSSALEFARIAKKVVTQNHDRISQEEYENRILELESILQEEQKAQTKEKKATPKKIKINIDVENNDDKVIIKKDEVIEEASLEVKTIEVSKEYKDIEAIINSLRLSSQTRLRDILREFGMALDSNCGPLEMVIFLLKNGEGFHYKKERVYEKVFQDEDIKDTLFEELIDNTDKSFILNIKDSLFDKNIITKQPYEENFKSVIGFRLYDGDEVVGAILYEFFTSEFSDKLIYEKLKMLTSMINVDILRYISKKREDVITKRNEFLHESSSSGLLSESDHNITLDEKAKKLLDIKETYLEDSEYIALIDAAYVNMYKGVMEDIYNAKIDKACIEYKIKGKFIRHNINTIREDITRIYGDISDITPIKKKEEDLENRAYTDPYSHIFTKSKLYDDLYEVVESKKFAVAIIAITNFKMYFDIYGYSFADDLVFAIGKTLKEILEDYKNTSVYYLERDKYVLLYKDKNDQRAVYNNTKAVMHKLKNKMFNINRRVNLDFKAGVFRYTKNMSIKDPKKILFYASEALMDAYENIDDECACMLYYEPSSLKRFKDSQVVLHVSEAIDSGDLKIKYRQVVNASDGGVEYYKASLNLVDFTIDEKYFLEVIEKRKLKEICNKYLISHTLSEMKTFKDQYQSYFKVMIPLYKSVLNSDTFISFIEKNMSFFKIPYNMVSFSLISDSSKEVIKEVSYLRSKGIEVISSDFDFTILNMCNAYFMDISKYNDDTIDMLVVCLHNLSIEVYASCIDNKDLIDKALKHNINICDGSYFKKMMKLEDIMNLFES